jgi:hypothetical protein
MDRYRKTTLIGSMAVLMPPRRGAVPSPAASGLVQSAARLAQ